MRILSGPWGRLLLLLSATPTCVLATPMATPVFINEFHYDNAGADVGEFIELAGPAGTDLNGWQLVLYNGLDGRSYRAVSLSGVLGDVTGSGFGFQVINFSTNGLQNGAPDGMALIDAFGGVQEFLSYEGSLIALDGPALGLASRDVGVSESATTPPGASLQRTGQGSLAEDFIWQAAVLATPGAGNPGQRLAPLPVNLALGGAWPLWLTGLAWLSLRRCHRQVARS